MKSWKPLKACVPYLGGKRQLLQNIFSHISSKAEAPIFADAFLGGGSVSLYAKARGYQVLCNDSAFRSFIVGRALIENAREKINREDMAALFEVPEKREAGYTERAYSPKIFTTRQARFIDTAIHNLKQTAEPTAKTWLEYLLLIIHILSIRAFGKFTHSKDAPAIEKEEWEYPLRSKAHAAKNLRHAMHPWGNLDRIRMNINRGVFGNARENQVFQLDALEFVKRIKADTLYLDPPYADTTAYEDEYKVLDEILAGGPGKESIDNPWSSSDTAREEFEKLFAAAQHIPHWIISMGQSSSEKGISAEELLGLVRKWRKAEVETIEHTWSVGNAGAPDTKTNNIEYLIYTL